MKTRRFDFNYRPLQINYSLTTVGSVPDTQTYNGGTGEYSPDYTIVPLTIQPLVSRMDRDGILPAGNVNASLANVRWYEVTGGTKTLIESSNTSYEVTTTGPDTGRIKVKKNSQPKVPITLQFYAEYVDTRTSQIHEIRASYLIKCKNDTSASPVLLINAPSQILYNPLRDSTVKTLQPFLRIGDKECPEANRKFVWEIFDNGSWRVLGTDDLDFFFSINDYGTLRLYCKVMGDEVTLRCRAKYSSTGDPDSVTLTDASPSRIINVVRRIPSFDYEIIGVPTNIPEGSLTISPEAHVFDSAGRLTETANLAFSWWMATNNRQTGLSYQHIGDGEAPILPTKGMDAQTGGVLGLDVQDRGAWGVWADSDGVLITDSDGSLILMQ